MRFSFTVPLISLSLSHAHTCPSSISPRATGALLSRESTRRITHRAAHTATSERSPERCAATSPPWRPLKSHFNTCSQWCIINRPCATTPVIAGSDAPAGMRITSEINAHGVIEASHLSARPLSGENKPDACVCFTHTAGMTPAEFAQGRGRRARRGNKHRQSRLMTAETDPFMPRYLTQKASPASH